MLDLPQRASISSDPTRPATTEHIAVGPFKTQDTEFPGVVAKPIGEFRSQMEYHFQVLRVNVNMLKLIQLGITFFDADGNVPHPVCTWQFNFKFSLQGGDMFAEDSIDLLQRSGLQFARHEQEGIDPLHFAELLMSSGLILSDDTYWITFHAGYDFGYLLKLLTCLPVPETEREFFKLLRIYFPTLYDVK